MSRRGLFAALEDNRWTDEEINTEITPSDEIELSDGLEDVNDEFNKADELADTVMYGLDHSESLSEIANSLPEDTDIDGIEPVVIATEALYRKLGMPYTSISKEDLGESIKYTFRTAWVIIKNLLKSLWEKIERVATKVTAWARRQFMPHSKKLLEEVKKLKINKLEGDKDIISNSRLEKNLYAVTFEKNITGEEVLKSFNATITGLTTSKELLPKMEDSFVHFLKTDDVGPFNNALTEFTSKMEQAEHASPKEIEDALLHNKYPSDLKLHSGSKEEILHILETLPKLFEDINYLMKVTDINKSMRQIHIAIAEVNGAGKDSITKAILDGLRDAVKILKSTIFTQIKAPTTYLEYCHISYKMLKEAEEK